MQRIPLRSQKGEIREYAIVSDEDYDYLNQWRWCLHIKGYAMRNQTRKGHGGHRCILMHRAVLERKLGRELAGGEYADHLNRQKLDNQRHNLRIATVSENNMNRAGIGASRYLGVFHSGKPNGKQWRVQIRHDGDQLHIGSFVKEDAAALFYDAYAIIHKIGTPLNFPETWGLKFGDD